MEDVHVKYFQKTTLLVLLIMVIYVDCVKHLPLTYEISPLRKVVIVKSQMKDNFLGGNHLIITLIPGCTVFMSLITELSFCMYLDCGNF